MSVNKPGIVELSKKVDCRYTLVVETSKRARQLIDGAEPKVAAVDRNGKERKPLSIAVDELYEGKVNILPHEEEDDDAAE